MQEGGWDFNAWRARDNWQILYSQQSGEADILRLTTRRELRTGWEAHARLWKFLTEEILGSVSDRPPTAPDCETLETLPSRSHLARLVRYRVTETEWVRAWLLEPAERNGLNPAVVVAHPATPDGKCAASGMSDDADLAWGVELAERGFVALVPDAIGFGDRQPGRPGAMYSSADDFFAVHRYGSAAAKMAFDISRAVDVLSCAPGVDAGKICALGHGMGGAIALFAAAKDDRIAATVTSCGFNLLRADPMAYRWWRSSCFMPRLGYYERFIDQTPIDFHHWIGLVAPRPLLICAALRDAQFPRAEALQHAAHRAREVYRLYDERLSLKTYCFQGEHGFPRRARLTAYRFLEESLR
jgi:dienelactone hydrolase